MKKIVIIAMFAVFSLILCQPIKSYAAEKDEALSFIVFGDNRLPGYLPYGAAEKDKINDFFEQVKVYVFGPDVQIQSDLGFDPKTGDLVWFNIWPEAAPDNYKIMALKNGWPQLMLRGTPPRVALRSEGQAWVYENVIKEIQQGVNTPGGPSFCLNTGDMTYNGHQGKAREESPYWSDFYRRFLVKLPEGAPKGLPARFFPAPGNHESWADENLVGFRSIFPYLEKLGFSQESRIYMFDYKGCRFIFLDTGDMDYVNPAAWGGKHPDFKEQMTRLTEWLEGAKKKKSRHIFITYHNPSFCRAGFGHLPKGQNPHPYIKPYADDLDITVLNGHVHTTEAYKVDGIRYLVLGAGGGEQRFDVNQMPYDYPVELYWKGNPRIEEYNYLVVTVSEDTVQFFIRRFRPTENIKSEKVELFKNQCTW